MTLLVDYKTKIEFIQTRKSISQNSKSPHKLWNITFQKMGSRQNGMNDIATLANPPNANDEVLLCQAFINFPYDGVNNLKKNSATI